ncbi:MAG: hypothetical protein ACI91B_005065 [Planctomycetota bacterium]|jgi:hypothetical protein
MLAELANSRPIRLGDVSEEDVLEYDIFESPQVEHIPVQ